MTSTHIQAIPVLEDNYAYLIVHGQEAMVVDPGEAAPVRQFLVEHSLSVDGILLTHYDYDHIGGVATLRGSGVPVIGPAPSHVQLDRTAEPDQDFEIGGVTIRVIDTPGHSFPHVAYYLPQSGVLFSGDCLFGAGCGRLSGNAAVAAMWSSLQAINRLPAETRIYFGHEYTLSNLAFARHIEPENPHIPARMIRETEKLERGIPTTPTTLGEERLTNPFLRVDSPAIRRHVDLPQATEVEVFAALRRMKNSFRG